MSYARLYLRLRIIDALDKPWEDRAIQEEKNVTLKNVFLKAYNRENDRHLKEEYS